jgi:outer membrane immunogenic protein
MVTTMNKLKTIALVSLMSSAALATSANANDNAQEYNWEGAYIGITASHLEGTSRQDNSAGATTGNYDIDGGFYGLLAGYNKDIGNNFILGFEGDIAFGKAEGTTINTCTLVCYSEINYLANIRTRLGYTYNNIMPFISAGISIAETEAGTAGTLAGQELHGENDEVGFNIGAGVDTKINENITLRFEYSHVDLGDSSYFIPSAGQTGTVPFDNNDIFRVAVTYSF